MRLQISLRHIFFHLSKDLDAAAGLIFVQVQGNTDRFAKCFSDDVTFVCKDLVEVWKCKVTIQLLYLGVSLRNRISFSHCDFVLFCGLAQCIQVIIMDVTPTKFV